VHTICYLTYLFKFPSTKRLHGFIGGKVNAKVYTIRYKQD
jgi:hypothetical protein